MNSKLSVLHKIYSTIIGTKLARGTLIFLFVNFLAPASSAKDLGVGVLLFSPTAISVQNYLNSNRSIDAALAWDFHKNSEIYLHSTYLFHKPNQIHIENYFFNLFYGVGAYLHNRKPETDLGCRFSLGSAYNVQTIPIEIFAELAANLNLVPNTAVNLTIGLGGRFYF